MALNILREFDIKSMEHNSPEYLHLIIEALRLAFMDCSWYVSDPTHSSIPLKELLSKEYARERAREIDPKQAQVSSSGVSVRSFGC